MTDLEGGEISQDLEVLRLNSQGVSVAFNRFFVLAISTVQKSVHMPAHVALQVVLEIQHSHDHVREFQKRVIRFRWGLKIDLQSLSDVFISLTSF